MEIIHIIKEITIVFFSLIILICILAGIAAWLTCNSFNEEDETF